MITIIKKLQDTSRNRRFLISETEKIVRLLLLAAATNSESGRIVCAFRPVKTYFRSTMRNNRLLMHVYKNILDNINLVDVANLLIEKIATSKHSDNFPIYFSFFLYFLFIK